MTVSSTPRRAGPFNGNGATTAFPFTFKVFATSDVAVYLTDGSGVQSLLGGNYTVSLNADQDATPGGTINYPTVGSPLPTGQKLDVVGSVPLTQGTDLTNLGRFVPQVIENALDRITIFAQQLLERASRALTFPIGETASATLPGKDARKGTVLAFHETTGEPLAGPSIGSVGTVAGNVGNVNTVAANIGAVNTTATNIGAVVDAPNQAAAAAASRAAIDSRIYPGTYAVAPTTRPDGTARQAGDRYVMAAGIEYIFLAGAWTDYRADSAASAASALASKNSATVSETNAGTSAAATGAAKTAAEIARDAANTIVKIFADTTAGIAGTSNGQAFGVLDATNLELVIYRNLAGVANLDYRLKLSTYFDGVFPAGFDAGRNGYLHAWLDSSSRLVAFISTDGKLWSKGVSLTDAATLLNATIMPGSQRDKYVTVFLDVNSRIMGGFLRNGELEVKGLNVSQVAGNVPINSKSIAIFGDSLTEGAGSTGGSTVGAQLQALYAAGGDSRLVVSSGYGGQTCASILARFGPQPALVTLPNGASGFPEIPASGSVNVTVTNAPLAYADPSQQKSITGTLRGVPCTLVKAANTGQYSITRTAAGAAIPVDSALPFIPDTAQYQPYTLVCWIGTNDILSSTPAQILAYMDSYLSWQSTVQKRRVIVMPAINCLSGSVATILANYAALLALVKAKYPNEYVDTLSLLQRNNDGSANDLADLAAGLPPRSLLFTDRYHLNNTGYAKVAAEIKRILDSKGY